MLYEVITRRPDESRLAANHAENGVCVLFGAGGEARTAAYADVRIDYRVQRRRLRHAGFEGLLGGANALLLAPSYNFV